MRKPYAAAILLAVLLTGCYWGSGENEQYGYEQDYDYVQVNNHTDDVIFVHYDYFTTPIAAGDHTVIAVIDAFFDADITVEYRGIIRDYDVDPDFFGWDEIDVYIEQFS